MRLRRWIAIGAALLSGALVLVVSKPLWPGRDSGPGAPPGSEASRRLVLPRADQALEDRDDRQEEPATTVNVHHRRTSPSLPCSAHDSGQVCREGGHWRISIASKECPPEAMRGPLEAEADLAREDEVDVTSGKRLSRRHARLRADRMAPYGLAQQVIETCGLVGIYKVEVGAEHPLHKVERRIDTWLPKSRVDVPNEMVETRMAIPRPRRRAEAEPETVEEIRVAMWWDPATRTTTRKLRHETIADDTRLQERIQDLARIRKPDAPLIVDAQAEVPWAEVVNVINLAKRSGIDRIEYALPSK